MTTHSMNLFPQPFEMIKSGKKDIELRLNDEKRQKIKVGDVIEFTNTESGEQLTAEVAALRRFESFDRLYRELDLLRCGYTPEDIASAKPSDMDEYYSPERQKQYGAIGIELRVI